MAVNYSQHAKSLQINPSEQETCQVTLKKKMFNPRKTSYM